MLNLFGTAGMRTAAEFHRAVSPLWIGGFRKHVRDLGAHRHHSYRVGIAFAEHGAHAVDPLGQFQRNHQGIHHHGAGNCSVHQHFHTRQFISAHGFGMREIET